jgi:glycosyltransferase involved in cell wall biosynthesis
MKVSIIIPCYNVASYIEQCIHSVCQKADETWEIICINDGSTDATLVKLYALQKEYEEKCNFYIINQKNCGLSESRNTGIVSAKGEYIAFIDSDDMVKDNYINTLVSNMHKESLDLVCVGYTRLFNKGTIDRYYGISGIISRAKFKRKLIGLIDEELKDPSNNDSLVTVWGKLYKTSIIKSHNLRLPQVEHIGSCEDLLFNLEYIKYCTLDVKIIDEPYYIYRKFNANSFTKKYRPLLFSQWQNLFKIINENVHTNDEHQALSNRISLSIIGLGLNELNNPNNKKEQRKNIKQIISDSKYQNALKRLNTKYLSKHWQLYY